MKCTNCNFQNSENTKFCIECGNPLLIVCPSCGQEIRVSSKFCSNCGNKFVGQPIPQKSAVKTAERESASAESFESARKQVTVFFSDVKGSISLIEKLDPEETTVLLMPVLDAMLTAVHRFGGTIIKTGSDGIMALFGAPIAYEDHALRACHAALYLQRTVNELESEISVRIGMNSGEVVVGVLHSDLRNEYDAIGPVVSIAARMEQLADPNMIQLSFETLKLIKDSVKVNSRGKMVVKGLSEPIEVYELIGIKQNFNRFIQLRNSALSPFIGCQAPMTLLDDNLDYALYGKGRVIGIVSEPGLGKSRLAYEFMTVSRAKNYIQYACQCQSMLRNNPFFVIKQALRGMFEINDLPQNAQISTITIKLKNLKLDVTHFQNICFSILDLPIEDPEWLELPPEFKRQEIINGFVKLFLSFNSSEPVIFLIEDMQFIDPESIECINQLVKNIRTAKILLLLTFRPEFKPEWVGTDFFTLIPLSPLKNDDFVDLVTNILGEDPKMDEFKKKLMSLCYGNPFFLEEMILSLKEHEILAGEFGNYHLLHPVDKISLPTTIHAVLDSRVDLLNQEEKKLLKTCSTIGKIILFDLLKDVGDYKQVELEKNLTALEERNFITKVQEYPEMLFSFKHDVILESIYNSLLKSQRKEIHLRIVLCLEEHFNIGGTEQLEIKADHAFRGEAWGKAFNFYMILQKGAHDRTSSLEALEHSKKASLAYSRIINPTREQSYQFIFSIFQKSHILIWLARFGEVKQLVDEATKITKLLNDRVLEAQIIAWIVAFGNCCQGNYEQMLQDCEIALKIGKEEEHRTNEFNAQLQLFIDESLLHANFYLGNYKECIDISHKLIDKLKICPPTDMSKGPLWGIGYFYLIEGSVHLGNFNLLKQIQESMLISLRNMKPSSDTHMWQCALAASYAYMGDFSESLKFADKAMESASQLALYLLSMQLLSIKGFILSLQGKREEARECLLKSYEIYQEKKFAFKASLELGFLCEGFLNINCIVEAKEICDKMVELCEARKQKGLGVIACRLKAEIAIKEGDFQLNKIEELYNQGISLAQEMKMLPEIAHNYYGLFRFFVKTDQHNKADFAYRQAMDLYTRMRMKFWPDEMKSIATT